MIIAFREISAIDGRCVKRFAIHRLPADRPDILPRRLVSGRHRILEQRVEARREVLEVVGIELEAETLRLLESSAAPRSPVHRARSPRRHCSGPRETRFALGFRSSPARVSTDCAGRACAVRRWQGHDRRSRIWGFSPTSWYLYLSLLRN